MNNFKKRLPLLLTLTRVALGPVALAVALRSWPHWLFVPILIAATLSDIYDGVLARRYGVATPALRRFDSIADVIFHLFILVCLWLTCRPVVQAAGWAIGVILLAEAASIAVCALKFGKYPATHSYLAKFLGLTMLAGLIALLGFGAGTWAVYALLIVDVLANVEIIIIHLLADQPPVDVKSVFT